MSKTINLTINGQSITVPEGTTILEAAKKANINIPTLCDNPDLCRRAICRICVVECDGGSKLIAACANDVWEGMNVVTNNQRILETRKTILELILANHPQDCLSCVRNTKCELQSLAESFGIRSVPFAKRSFDRSCGDTAVHQLPSIESETLVRDMDKCIKCACCVEACQTVQTIGAINTSGRSEKFEICTPYGQALSETPCVFCGQCAAVCPVGAIYEHDQGAEVFAALASALGSGQPVIAQVSTVVTAALDSEFNLAAGIITAGKIIAALKLLGFAQIFDAAVAANVRNFEINSELQKRIKSGGRFEKSKLPLISGCSEGVYRFVKNFYPDLTDHLVANSAAKGLGASNNKTVSFVSCVAQKFGSDRLALTAGELARMIKLAGINISALPEEPFDTINAKLPNHDSTASPEIVRGFAEARKVMEAIREGKCNAQWIEVLSCFDGNCCTYKGRLS